MWYKLSLLLFLIFCCCNVTSKNLRKSLNQKFDGYGTLEDSLYPNAAPNVNEARGDVYVPDDDGTVAEKHPIVVDAQHNNDDEEYGLQSKEHDLMDDSYSGRKKPSEMEKPNEYMINKHLKDILAEIQYNEYGNIETPAKKNDNKLGKQKH
uniref:Uncharacterized protein n=1 Tax=Panagrolaimus sp. PS1159 TaxID=55785 RepID=A0AC35GKU9_9BILA